MDKGPPQPPPPSLFVNDGSFMERFKQLRGEEPKPSEKDKSASEKDSNPKPVITGKPLVTKTGFQLKPIAKLGNPTPPSGGKLAFSLKQKSKLVATPLKLGGDEDEEDNEEIPEAFAAKRQKCETRSQPDMAPLSPSDPTVKKVADKLACFVAKNGREFEDVTREKNPGESPFKFLFDKTSSDYKYYEFKLNEELHSVSKSISLPASSFTEGPIEDVNDEQNGNSLAMMDFYMKKAAQEERNRPLKQSSDEMPPPSSLQSKRGHHMGDYIPPEELEKFLASCNDADAAKAFKEFEERAKIQADNVGHKLLSKMGWKEGEGLGSSSSGMSDPIMAGNVKQDHLGLGAHQPGEVTSEDDIYEQYKKRMMLGYRYRPNPLNNPRKAYY